MKHENEEIFINFLQSFLHSAPDEKEKIRIRDLGSGAFMTPGPGSGIRNRFFPDLGSRIPIPYFLELSDKFLGKKFYNSLKTGIS
jgi:hypothetical protein